MDRISLTGSVQPAAVHNSRAEMPVRVPPQVSVAEEIRSAEEAVLRSGQGYVTHPQNDNVSVEEIQKRAVETVRQAINDAGAAIEEGARLVIRHDDATGRFVYEFRNPQTDEVVQQFPAEEVLKAMASFRQALAGTALDQEV